MIFTEQILSQEIIHALGWTILHALWQGTLVALALAVCMFFLTKSSAQIRYFISVSALATMLIISLITFYSVLPDKPINEISNQSEFEIDAPHEPVNQNYIYIEKTDIISQISYFVDYFNQHLPVIVTVWLLGVCIFSLKLLGGLAYIQRMKNYRVKAVGEMWHNKVKTIANQLGIKKHVSILESALVKVPLVVGHLKPVILLPLGTISGLSPNQLEAILAHEIAHIARNDFMVNILQSFIDILFFYHPAMWWISTVIRDERENCCDDIAVAVNKDSITFARALTELQEVHWRQPVAAMAIKGNKGKLKARVERLINTDGRNTLSASFKEGFITAIMVFVAILGFSFTINQTYFNKANNSQLVIDSLVTAEVINEPIKQDTLIIESQDSSNVEAEIVLPNPDLRGVSITMEDGRYVFARLDNENNVVELFIEGKKIKKNKFDNHLDVLIEIKESVDNKNLNKAILEAEKLKRDNLKSLVIKNQLEELDEMRKLKREINALQKKQIAVGLSQKEIQLLKVDLQRELDEKNQEELKRSLKEVHKLSEETKKLSNELVKEYARTNLQTHVIMTHEVNEKIKLLKEERNAIIEQIQKEQLLKELDTTRETLEKEKIKHNALRDNILAQLVKDGLIKSIDDKMELKLTKDELIINNKAQSGEYLKKCLQIYKDIMGKEMESKQNFIY
ncbi:M56 family metallopeptidase [Chondrinema litorale]|uniref:M56 family metallopeptidase n=1 Tax=Chondrinema litorale TaxID=2994555 RepID=UPI002544C550|nr:M56 family metallopeptidase [Chondrinema litorale]UZR95349.1 M48 family metalloprotease [Chondrinema litorale]